MQDWQRWHDDYADASSDLSRRLAVVQQHIRGWSSRAPSGRLRILSLCAGQGHDVVGALRDDPRRDDITGRLVELDPGNVDIAAAALAAAGLTGVRAVVGDAGLLSALQPAAPADLLLACGVFGNISDEDVRRTVAALPTLCAPGATVIWTRHRRRPDLTPAIRQWFGEAGFEELQFDSPGPGHYAVGVARLTLPGPGQADQRLFRFLR